jgi:hypothetical protein
MKKFIAPLLVVSLLAPQLSFAKNSDLVKVEYVQQVENNKKGFPLILAFVRIGFRLYRVLSRVNNVNKLVRNVKRYVDQHGLNRTQIAQQFAGKMEIVLIDSFYATSPSYKRFEPIMFKAKLKQRAYTYLVSVSDDGACLLFPNRAEKKNLYHANSYHSFADKNYKIYANTKGVERFYFVSSTQSLLSNLKSAFNISTSVYSCGKRHKGVQKLNQLKSMSGVEVRGVEVLIE